MQILLIAHIVARVHQINEWSKLLFKKTLSKKI